MKRNKFLFCLSKIVLALGLSLAVFSCKTAPQVATVPVYAFDVLDDEGAMYIHIPVAENKELSQKLVLAYTKGMSESDANLLVSKLEDVYASFGSRADKKRVQIAVEGSLPSVASSFLKKDGYEEKKYNAKGFTDFSPVYSYFAKDKMQLAFPGSNIICISPNVLPMLDLYEKEFEILNGIGNSENDFVTEYRSEWQSSDLYKWICEDVPSIHFYIVRPQAFLSNLIGSDVSSRVFKLVFAKGNFSKLPNDKYELILDLEFQNEKYVKPAISMLILTLGLTDSEIKRVSPTHIQLTGVHMNTKQLTNMLGL